MTIYFTLTHTMTGKKNIHGLTNKTPPPPDTSGFYTHAGLCMRLWSVCGGAVGWHRCPAVQHTHQTHTRCTQLFQCTLGFNYDHTEHAKYSRYKKRIKQPNKPKKKNPPKQNPSQFVFHFGVFAPSSAISFNNTHHFVSSSSCHTQT